MCGVPYRASGAYTFASGTVVVVQARQGHVVASSSLCAPSGIRLEGNAVATVVVAGAAFRDDEALLGLRTPTLTSHAQAAAVGRVVAIGAGVRNVKALLAYLAPTSLSDESEAGTCIIEGGAAPGHLDAGRVGPVPTLTGRTGALSSFAVMGVLTACRDFIAGVGLCAPAVTGLV